MLGGTLAGEAIQFPPNKKRKRTAGIHRTHEQRNVMLRDIENLAVSVLANIDVDVYVKSVDHRFLYVNSATARTLGTPADQLTGRLDTDILPQRVAEHLRELDAKVFETGEKQQGEETFVGADGRVRHFWTTKVLWRRPGFEDCLLGYSTEITRLKDVELSLKQSNDALQQSEAMFRQAFDSANTGMCIVNLNGALTKVNRRMTEIFGYSEDELTQMTVNDLAIADDRKLSTEFIEHAVQGEARQTTFEKRYRHKNGQIIHCVVSSSLVHDSSGLPKFFVSQVQDITRTRHLEQQLNTSEQRHRLLLEYASDILWSMRSDGTFKFFNRSVKTLLGYEQEVAMTMSMEAFLAPEAIPVAHEYLSRVHQAIANRTEPPKFHGEIRQRCKDGTLIWTDILAFPIVDHNGDLSELLGVSRNIEERKQYELELRQARDKAEAAQAALERAIVELRNLASTDALTGAMNRRQFELALNRQIVSAKRHGEPLCLVMFDIDHFKRINDGYGHSCGDQVLVQVSQIVRNSLREGDVFGRWGGEEFLILLPYCDLENGKKIAEGIRQRFAHYEFPSIGQVTASFGVAQWDRAETSSRWIMRADQAMYAAKGAGRNMVRAG